MPPAYPGGFRQYNQNQPVILRLPRQWLEPPTLTQVSVSALAWFGWRFVDQQRLLESQRARRNGR
jgi:hypothetical protein